MTNVDDNCPRTDGDTGVTQSGSSGMRVSDSAAHPEPH
jgi:hypothetical protein